MIRPYDSQLHMKAKTAHVIIWWIWMDKIWHQSNQFNQPLTKYNPLMMPSTSAKFPFITNDNFGQLAIKTENALIMSKPSNTHHELRHNSLKFTFKKSLMYLKFTLSEPYRNPIWNNINTVGCLVGWHVSWIKRFRCLNCKINRVMFRLWIYL